MHGSDPFGPVDVTLDLRSDAADHIRVRVQLEIMEKETCRRMAARLFLHFEKNILNGARSERSAVDGEDIAAKVTTIPLAPPPRHQRDDPDAIAIPWKIGVISEGDLVELPQRRRGQSLLTVRQRQTRKPPQAVAVAEPLDERRNGEIQLSPHDGRQPRNRSPHLGGLVIVKHGPAEERRRPSVQRPLANRFHAIEMLEIGGQENDVRRTLQRALDFFQTQWDCGRSTPPLPVPSGKVSRNSQPRSSSVR